LIDAPGEYKVQLDAFYGPLDLLLYLIKKAEVDIYDIPISTITDQYVEHIELLHKVDLAKAGEFMETAAMLMEIKSKMLLPREEVTFDEIEDPRSDLVKQLLEYRRFKHLAVELEQKAADRAKRFSRGITEKIERNQEEVPLEDVTLWDLLQAFGKLLKETGSETESQIIHDETPVRTYMAQVMQQLEQQPSVTFTQLFEQKKNLVERIGLFLALLELTRMGQIKVEQTADFKEINLVLA
jgi:segregation and condensation protein A